MNLSFGNCDGWRWMVTGVLMAGVFMAGVLMAGVFMAGVLMAGVFSFPVSSSWLAESRAGKQLQTV